jgi:hypothetical protein
MENTLQTRLIDPVEVIKDDLNRLLDRTAEYLCLTKDQARLKLINMLSEPARPTHMTSLVKRSPACLTREDIEDLDSTFLMRRDISGFRSAPNLATKESIIQQVLDELATKNLHSTEDPEKVEAVKMLTISASLAYRFGINKPKKPHSQQENEALIAKMMKGVEFSAGKRGPSKSEEECLKHINNVLVADGKNSSFVLNSITFFRGNFSCTPDAIMRDEHQNVMAVAEFKSIGAKLSPSSQEQTQEMSDTASSGKNNSALRHQKSLATHQVQIAMEVLGCDIAYVVIHQKDKPKEISMIRKEDGYISRLDYAVSRLRIIRSRVLDQKNLE